MVMKKLVDLLSEFWKQRWEEVGRDSFNHQFGCLVLLQPSIQS